MANSLMQIVSDGGLSTVPLTIKFFDQSHIRVLVGDSELPDGTYSFAWAGPTTLTITPVVPNGIGVTILRKTPADAVLHDFQAGALFNELSIDENFQQELFLLQEASEQSLVTDLFDDLDMHGNRIRNLADAVLPGDAVTLAQAEDLASSGGTSTLRDELAAANGVDLVGGAVSDADLAFALSSVAQGDGSSKVVTVNANLHPMLLSAKNGWRTSIAILQTGQSLAEGGVGFDYTPTMQPLNRMCRQLIGGPIGMTTETLGVRTKILQERGIRGTCGTSLADMVASSGAAAKVYFHGQAWGGKAYIDLQKGGPSGVFEKCITQVGSINAVDSDVEYAAVHVLHGEQDGLDNNAAYDSNLSTWIADFNTDIKAITGQVTDIQMYHSQTNSACGYGQVGGLVNTNFLTPIQQLAASISNPLITLVGPKYQYKYFDNSHITNAAQAMLGEKAGQAIAWQMLTGQKWQPLRPSAFSLAGNTLTITFTGTVLGLPGRALAFEATAINAIANQGFEYKDDSGRTITSVQLVGSNQVRITLSGTAGANPIIAYAYKNGIAGTPAQAAGNGERGTLRDDDPTTSKLFGNRLYNYCVTFREVL